MDRRILDPDAVVKSTLPTRYGVFSIYGFENLQNGEESVALVKGVPPLSDGPLVRIHSQCFTGDTLHSLRCDCGDQLEHALKAISRANQGVLIYQMQEGRGIGLINKLRAYELQDQGADTVDANLQLGFDVDMRDYEFCSGILKYLGAFEIRFMSNNPEKLRALEDAGIRILERVPLIIQSSPLADKYLRTKKERMGHLL